jgi:hypothetical protein
MPSTNQETIRIPDWVPDAARLRVVELQALPWLDEAERKLLDRLATYDTMKTGVWEKLPSEAKGFEGSIIDWAWFAFVFFRRRPRPYPKTKSKAKWDEWRKHLPRQTLPDFRHTGNLLRIVLNQIIQHYGDAQAYWQRFWEGDKNLTLDRVIAIMDQVSSFYLKVDEEYQLVFRTLPEVKRWSGRKPAQKFFTEFLSKQMTRAYGQPLDLIVATLAEVAFDIVEGVDAETIRGRRRTPGKPENSRQKSR